MNGSLQKTVELLVQEKLVTKRDLEFLHEENSKLLKKSAYSSGTDGPSVSRDFSVLFDSMIEDKQDEADAFTSVALDLNSELEKKDECRIMLRVTQTSKESASVRQIHADFSAHSRVLYTGQTWYLVRLWVFD